MRYWHWVRIGVVICLATHVALLMASSRITLHVRGLTNKAPLAAAASPKAAGDLSFDNTMPLESWQSPQSQAIEAAGFRRAAATVPTQLPDTPAELKTKFSLAVRTFPVFWPNFLSLP